MIGCPVLFSAPVAPRAGAWIETKTLMKASISYRVSRPVRARGLKHSSSPSGHGSRLSRPVRARGLKQRLVLPDGIAQHVAPRAGAWIETVQPYFGAANGPVAPRAGAWIETMGGSSACNSCRSRPVRARGLKLHNREQRRAAAKVAPRAGAWIETTLNWWEANEVLQSRPVRARGLKLQRAQQAARPRLRRAPCGRVD